MANFLPLKEYVLYCLDRLVEQFGLTSPFLDIGCGIADVTQHLARKGWHGRAIDFSESAVSEAQDNLSRFYSVEVMRKSLFEETGVFNTVLLMDVLEHIENDSAALQKIYSLLSPHGYLVVSVPSNHREWRWDDEVYGHYRRYSQTEIKNKLLEANFTPLVLWDFTYPVFWLMRRIQTRAMHSPNIAVLNKAESTKLSTSINTWEIPLVSDLLERKFFLWDVIYKIQFQFFKDKVDRGHEMIILARKENNET